MSTRTECTRNRRGCHCRVLASLARSGMDACWGVGCETDSYRKRVLCTHRHNLSLFLPCFKATYEFHGRQLDDSTQRNATQHNPQEEARSPPAWHGTVGLHRGSQLQEHARPRLPIAIRPNTQRCGLFGSALECVGGMGTLHSWHSALTRVLYRLASAPMGIQTCSTRSRGGGHSGGGG